MQGLGNDAIHTRSREFLSQAILAVQDVYGMRADFTMVCEESSPA